MSDQRSIDPKRDPPFDGKPCPCCPMEVRNLFAVAHNLVSRIAGRSMSSDTTWEDLEHAVKAMQPLIDAHFADSLHSQGVVR